MKNCSPHIVPCERALSTSGAWVVSLTSYSSKQRPLFIHKKTESNIILLGVAYAAQQSRADLAIDINMISTGYFDVYG